MPNVTLKPGNYENVWFHSEVGSFVCPGDLTLINCKSNSKIFVMGDMICVGGEFQFLDAGKKAYVENCKVLENISAFMGLKMVNVEAKNIVVTGHAELANVRADRLDISCGNLRATGEIMIKNINKKEPTICLGALAVVFDKRKILSVCDLNNS